jgi:hypothetical protein
MQLGELLFFRQPLGRLDRAPHDVLRFKPEEFTGDKVRHEATVGARGMD